MARADLPDEDVVFGLLREVIDPELGSDIVDLGMAKGARIEDDGNVIVTIALTTSGCPLRAQIQRDVRARVGSLPGVTHVKLDWTEMTQDERSSAMAKAYATEAAQRIEARERTMIAACQKPGVTPDELKAARKTMQQAY